MNPRQSKKADRKQKRFQESVLKEAQIEPSIDQTNNIAVCNAGQATGLTSEALILFADKYLSKNHLTRCILPKGKSYCFLQFQSEDSAFIFYSKIHGTLLERPDESKGPLYLCYIKSVPSNNHDFSTDLPPGLTLMENFITVDEEKEFMKVFNWENSEGALKHREVRHFGYEFRYGSNDVDKDTPLKEKIPDICELIWKRLANHNDVSFEPADQLTVNKYNPGQGIPPHVDTHSPFGPVLISVSLGSPVVMDWKHWSGKKTEVNIPNRSILIMEKESRYDWMHGIAARSWDPVKSESSQENGSDTFGKRSRGLRISLTFRWTSSTICQCDYPHLCDRQTFLLKEKLKGTNINDKDVIATALEDIHVHQVYEDIAPHFSITRHKPWPRVIDFVNQLPAGSLLLDLGAGNGKNIQMRNDLIQIAVERSFGLLKICMEQCRKTNSSDCLRGDIMSVPLKDSIADAIICIAVLHHFANKDRRKKAISEIVRLLKEGGNALITVWARDQCGSSYLKEDKNDSTDNFEDSVQSHNILPGLSLPVHENRTQFKQGDLLVPWKLRKTGNSGKLGDDNAVLLRYYHVFEKGELDDLCSDIPHVFIKDSFYEQGNWCIILTKSETT